MNYTIKKIALICFIYFCLTNIASAIETGLYLSPKFIFSVSSLKVNDKKVNNMYIGAGASIGYNFYALHQYTPIRVEFEYLYRNGLNENVYSDTNTRNINVHTFLFGGYYDFHFLPVNYNPIEESKVYKSGKRYLMNVYLGMLMGADLEQSITQTIVEKTGMISISNLNEKAKFNFGFGFGFGLNITTFIMIDIGYRILINTDIKVKHDIIAALRLNF